MNVVSSIWDLKVGDKVRLQDDDPGTIREVCGYEWYSDRAYILFRDGTKLNSRRLVLISEVMQCKCQLPK